MVSVITSVYLLLATATLDAVETKIGVADPVRSALLRGDYPWYDAKTGAPKSILPTELGSGRWLAKYFRWLDRLRLPRLGSFSFGDLLILGIVVLAVTIFLILLIEAWRRYRPGVREEKAVQSEGSVSVPIAGGLPAGLPTHVRDPWAEANRLRAAGDYAGAVIYLFTHQLLTLDRLKLLRLVPGRTGRQLVESIADRQLRDWVDPCRRLFERAYYGHHVPSREDFDRVWDQALAFERGVAGKAMS